MTTIYVSVKGVFWGSAAIERTNGADELEVDVFASLEAAKAHFDQQYVKEQESRGLEGEDIATLGWDDYADHSCYCEVDEPEIYIWKKEIA
jgi:hypothetical protein